MCTLGELRDLVMEIVNTSSADPGAVQKEILELLTEVSGKVVLDFLDHLLFTIWYIGTVPIPDPKLVIQTLFRALNRVNDEGVVLNSVDTYQYAIDYLVTHMTDERHPEGDPRGFG